METILVIVLLALILGGAVRYIYKAKKSGVKCIGCPSGGKCAGNCACCSAECGEKNQ